MAWVVLIELRLFQKMGKGRSILLDAKGVEYGPFFFMQVKTTEGIARDGYGISARFNSAEVRAAQARKVPLYLVAVERVEDEGENVYALGIDSRLSGGGCK